MAEAVAMMDERAGDLSRDFWSVAGFARDLGDFENSYAAPRDAPRPAPVGLP